MIAEALVAAVGGDAPALERIGGALGAAIRAARAELAALPPETRRQRRAVWAAVARSPVPPGFRGVHPSWIEAALDALPERARADLSSGGTDPVGVWLVRRACGALPAMPVVRLGGGDIASLDIALTLDPARLVAWLESIGADQVAVLAIFGKTPALIERMPGPLGATLRAALKRVWPYFQKDALGPMRAVAARCANTPLEDRGLLRIGARTIAPHVATRVLADRQLATRLPIGLGRLVLDELRRHATVPLEHAPAWRAIARSEVLGSFA